jgi:tRNA1Val (adenine37-N6)-methyltransferase
MTVDSPAPGVWVAQPARGFRYTSDAMWLAGFALRTGPLPRNALDLGTGSGVVALLLGAHGIETLGLELRPEWTELWSTTLARSTTSARVELRQQDVREPLSATFELVVANPPFFPKGTGPVAPDPWKRAARTESTATLLDFLARARSALAPGGRACFILPRDREGEVLGYPLVVSRWLRIGRRRTLFCLRHEGPATSLPEQTAEDSEAARALVEAATRPGG